MKPVVVLKLWVVSSLISHYRGDDLEKLLANEIREYLKLHLSGRKFLSEFTFRNNGTIADLLDINNQIIGYEIKSDSDTYARLPKQIEGYNSVCRKIYMVVGESKSSSVFLHIPEFYGVIVAKRKENGLVEFDMLREASNNPHWTTEALLWWLPSDNLKQFSKTIPTILDMYDGKKTPINKLNKYDLVKIIDKHASQYQIEIKVLSYLRSNELHTKRVEARRINESMKNQTQRISEREQQHRLQNWSCFKDDLRQISQSDALSRMSRLQGLGRNYLPLSLEFNYKGVHNGKFVFNELTRTVDFLLKGNGKIKTLRVPDVIHNLTLINVLHRALETNMSLTEIRPLIIKCIK